MMKYALYTYVPRRRVCRTSFEQQDINRMIIGFKDGRNVYTRWAARQFAKTLAFMDMTEYVIVCVPASTNYSHVRRWKRFSHLLAKMTGAEDGFQYVSVSGSRKRAHITGEYELANNIKHYVHIDAEKLYCWNDPATTEIYTTGQSSNAFTAALEAAGATVCMAMFLAKTKQYCTR